MQNQPLVSIITPGYNCGAVVHRLLDSILAQTWQNIEFIFVNDGSTDNTAEVLDSYREKFAARGITMTVIYQENQGQAVALGNGLQHFTGDYLCWCDSDDYLEADAMESRVIILEQNPEYTVVVGQTNNIDSKSMTITHVRSPHKVAAQPNKLFMSILQDSNQAYYCCGAYMVRSTDFLLKNPSKYIYPSRTGQNIQMLLPSLYNCGVYVINKPVYNYVIYSNSHSHADRSKEQKLDRYQDMHTIRVETLNHMNIPAELRNEYVKLSMIAMYKSQYSIALQYQDKELARKLKRILKNEGAYSFQDAKNYWETIDPVFRLLLRIYRKLYSILRKVLRKE